MSLSCICLSLTCVLRRVHRGGPSFFFLYVRPMLCLSPSVRVSLCFLLSFLNGMLSLMFVCANHSCVFSVSHPLKHFLFRPQHCNPVYYILIKTTLSPSSIILCYPACSVCISSLCAYQYSTLCSTRGAGHIAVYPSRSRVLFCASGRCQQTSTLQVSLTWLYISFTQGFFLSLLRRFCGVARFVLVTTTVVYHRQEVKKSECGHTNTKRGMNRGVSGGEERG